MALTVFAFTVLVWSVAGRLLTAHLHGRHAVAPVWMNPLATLAAGMGLGWAWMLLFVPLVGMHALVAAGLGSFCILILSGGMFQTWRGHRDESHTAPLLVFTALLMAPLLACAWPPVFQTVDDFHVAHHLAGLATWPAWPSPEQLTGAALPSLSEGAPGWLFTWLPVATLSTYQGAALAAFQMMTLTLSVAGLHAATGLPVKWSNLLLTAAALACVGALLTPVLLPVLSSPQSTLLLMALVLAVALPLVQPTPLPHGVPMLMPALAATALTLAHPQGVWAAAFFTAFYAVRTLAQGIASLGMAVRALFGLAAMACFPALAFAGWQVALSQSGQPLWPLLPTLTPPGLPPLLAVVGAGGALLLLLKTPRPTGPLEALRAALTGQSVLTLPLATAAASFVFPPLGLWGTWLFVLPLVHLWLRFYKHSPLRQMAFQNPWGLGALLGFISLSLSLLGGTFFNASAAALSHPGAPLLQRFHSIVQHISSDGPVVTLGLNSTENAALAAALAPRAPVQTLPENPSNFNALSNVMHTQGYTTLVAAPTTLSQKQLAEILNVNPPIPALMVFRTVPQGLALIAAEGLQNQENKP